MITDERIANLYNNGMNRNEVFKYLCSEVPFDARGELFAKIDAECQRQFYARSKGMVS